MAKKPVEKIIQTLMERSRRERLRDLLSAGRQIGHLTLSPFSYLRSFHKGTVMSAHTPHRSAFSLST